MNRSVVVIGAGITGSLVGWRLARAGWRVTVVEAQHVGAGSSSRTAAGIRQQFSTPESVLGMRYSVDFYRRFAEEVGGETSPIVQNGYLFLSATTEDWSMAQRRVAVQRAAGLAEVEALEADALAERFPWVDRLAVLGGTFCPTDGFLRPEMVYNEAVAALVRLGGRLVTQAPVTGGRARADGTLTAVETPQGVFEADLFVDATNAWSPRLGRLLGATDLPIAPRKRYLWMCERAGSLDAAAFRAMPLVIAPSGAYCRPENDASLLMGWAHDAPDEPAFSHDDQDRIEERFWHRAGPDSMGYDTWLSLAEVIPALGEFAGLTATTCGYYGVTPDHNPFLGYDPAVPNLLRLAGFSGHGAMFGPFTALVAEALAEAGRNLDTVPTLGRNCPLKAFALGRPFLMGEHMVI